MTTKKEDQGQQPSKVKGLLVRSLGPRRGRAGYNFTPDFTYVDVQEDGLTNDEVDQIVNDPELVVLEQEGRQANKKDVAIAQRRNPDGGFRVGTTALGNSTLETATEEMNEAALAGEQPPPHPSGPGGVQNLTTTIHPDAVQANIDRLQTQAPPQGATAPKKRGRPSKKSTKPTAKPAETASKDTNPLHDTKTE